MFLISHFLSAQDVLNIPKAFGYIHLKYIVKSRVYLHLKRFEYISSDVKIDMD